MHPTNSKYEKNKQEQTTPTNLTKKSNSEIIITKLPNSFPAASQDLSFNPAICSTVKKSSRNLSNHEKENSLLAHSNLQRSSFSNNNNNDSSATSKIRFSFESTNQSATLNSFQTKIDKQTDTFKHLLVDTPTQEHNLRNPKIDNLNLNKTSPIYCKRLNEKKPTNISEAQITSSLTNNSALFSVDANQELIIAQEIIIEECTNQKELITSKINADVQEISNKKETNMIITDKFKNISSPQTSHHTQKVTVNANNSRDKSVSNKKNNFFENIQKEPVKRIKRKIINEDSVRRSSRVKIQARANLKPIYNYEHFEDCHGEFKLLKFLSVFIYQLI